MEPDDPDKAPARDRAKQVPELSPLLLTMFEKYAGHYLARHFHALRLFEASRATAACWSPILA